MDKAGGFIGFLFVPTGEKGVWKNLSEMLVQNGLASVHFTAERSAYYNQLISAQSNAKSAKLGIWKNHVEDEHGDADKQNQTNDMADRKISYKKVLPTEIYSGFRFAAQSFDDGKNLF